MNPSPTPADKQTLAYGHLLAEANKLKRSDQLQLVRALAGQLGMIAVFPGQLPAAAAPVVTAPKGRNNKKGPAKQVPSNPLSGSPEKKAFDAAKKAVSKKQKENGGAKLPSSDPLVRALESAKDKYFRSLSNAKGTKTAQSKDWADSESEEEPPKAAPKASPPKTTPPRAESSTTSTSRRK